MAHLFDNAHDDPDDRLQDDAPERPRWVWVAGVAGLAMAGIVSALLWRSYGDGLPSFPSFASVTAPAATPAAQAPDKPVGSKDFQAFQQQIAASLQSTAQLVAAQQAEIKRMSDQVIALSAKIDTLQRPPASAQAAIPAPPPAPAATVRKKPAAAPKPAPAISVGGAPLPPPSGR